MRRIVLALLLLALPAHAERRISLVIPPTQIRVGQTVRLPVSIPEPISIKLETLDLAILYPESLRVTAVDQVMHGCVAQMSIAPNIVRVAAVCQGAQWLSGPLVWLTIQGLTPAHALLDVTDCAFGQIRGTDSTGYPQEWTLDCGGKSGVVEVVP